MNVKRRTSEDFITKAKEVHGDKYDYSLTEFKHCKIKVKILCPIHGEFEQLSINHINGQGCKKCYSNKRKTDDKDFITNSNTIHENKYNYSLVNYINAYTKVKIICPIHGEFEQTPNVHLNKNCGCPKCNESKGERIIRNILNDNNVPFIRQHTFTDCINKKELPFDFYLPDYNICIEYDGRQHYDPIKYWGGEETLFKIQYNDKIKTKYCIQNNIKLIRIKYNENIEVKLKGLI